MLVDFRELLTLLAKRVYLEEGFVSVSGLWV